MAMTVGQGPDEEQDVMAAINTTPLVDVMLVLLIIFLITIPVVVQQVPLTLPKERNVPTQTKPENVVIAVNKDGDVIWSTTQESLGAKFRGASADVGEGKGSARMVMRPPQIRPSSHP